MSNIRGRRTRLALLTAARELVEAVGFGALTMAAVAERAGVTRRAVYLHFKSRAELIAELFRYINEVEDLEASTRPVLEAPDAVTALDEWAKHMARYHPRVIGVSRANLHALGTDPEAAALWDLVTADWMTWCRRLARGLHGEGRLAAGWTVDSAADMLWVLMSTDVIEGLVSHRGWSERKLARALSRLFRSTFVSRVE